MKLSTAVAQAMCNALVDSLDGGAGPAIIELRTGSAPATVDTAATGTLLATLTCSDPAFGTATNASPAVATASAVTQDSAADATGTAGYFRAYDSTPTAILDGTVSATGGGGELQLDSVSIVAGGTVSVTAWTVSMPTS